MAKGRGIDKYEQMKIDGASDDLIKKTMHRDNLDKLKGGVVSAINRLHEDKDWNSGLTSNLCDAVNDYFAARGFQGRVSYGDMKAQKK